MVIWGCYRVASGPFCACAAATATAVLFWWSVWLWSCFGVLGGRPLRWLVFRNTEVCWFVAEVTASTTMTHRAAVQERGNTDRTKDKKISYLGGIPVRLVLVGRPRRPTDRRRSSDEHTNKREVELTSISQQTTTEGTPLSCTDFRTASQEPRTRQLHSNTRRLLPGEFLQRRSGRVHRHPNLALAC